MRRATGARIERTPGERMTQPKDTIYCSKCGTELPSIANFCHQCGQPQKATAPSESAATSSITLTRRWAWGAGPIPFDVFIDDKYAGNIKISTTATFTVPPGEHKI